MKDNEQKDDYYSVSKQPPMPMGAPAPPPPMPMDPSMGGMPMPPMGGGMPPGAPMPPQEEELQEGEYMDPVTGKVMRRGEEFKVDPDRELDDPKNIAKWFDTLKKNSAAPSWTQPKSNRGTHGYGYKTTYDLGGGYGGENEEEGFHQEGEVMETTPALSNMMQGREVERYGNRVASLEDRKNRFTESTRPSRLQRLMGKKPPEFNDLDWNPRSEENLQDAKSKLETAQAGEKQYRGNRDYTSLYGGKLGEGSAYGEEGHIIERMPHPEVEGEDSHGTMEGGAGYGQGAYTSLYEDKPDWFKNVQG